MREIKFRAWDKRGNAMHEVFSLTYSKSGVISVCFENANGHLEYWHAGEDAELMQYTGLRDKNGKEVYHGDLLKSAGGISEIVWHYNRWAIRNEHRRIEEIGKDFHYFFEVCGNVTENPELLNV